MRPLGTVLLYLLVFVAACVYDDGESDSIRGSGNVITDTRTVTGFDAISVEGFGEVIVEVGPAESLTVDAEDNVMPFLVTEIDGRTLRLTTEENTSFRDVEEPVYTVTMPDLVLVAIGGSGSVNASGVDSESLTVSIAGSGAVDPSGRVTSLVVSIGGSGSFRGEDLVATDGTVSIGGSGSVVVNATDTLFVSIAGSGDVTYLGDPLLSQSITGVGTVEAG